VPAGITTLSNCCEQKSLSGKAADYSQAPPVIGAGACDLFFVRSEVHQDQTAKPQSHRMRTTAARISSESTKAEGFCLRPITTAKNRMRRWASIFGAPCFQHPIFAKTYRRCSSCTLSNQSGLSTGSDGAGAGRCRVPLRINVSRDLSQFSGRAVKFNALNLRLARYSVRQNNKVMTFSHHRASAHSTCALQAPSANHHHIHHNNRVNTQSVLGYWRISDKRFRNAVKELDI
jgi:hypothetical protein